MSIQATSAHRTPVVEVLKCLSTYIASTIIKNYRFPTWNNKYTTEKLAKQNIIEAWKGGKERERDLQQE